MNQSPYRNLQDIPLEHLEQLLLQLREAGISSSDLYAFANAKDVLEYREQLRSEGEEDVTVEDALAASCDAAYEDCRDDVLELYASVRVCLEKMGEL